MSKFICNLATVRFCEVVNNSFNWCIFNRHRGVFLFANMNNAYKIEMRKLFFRIKEQKLKPYHSS